MRTGGDQHGVHVETLLAAVGDGQDPVRPVEASGAVHDGHPVGGQVALDVLGLGDGERLHPGVEPGQVDTDPRVEHHTERAGVLDLVHHVGDGDQRLARNTVGEHRRPAQTVAVDEDHLCAELRRGQRGLVSARAAADDPDACHPTILPQPSRPEHKASGGSRNPSGERSGQRKWVREMTDTLQTTTQQPRSSTGSLMVLVTVPSYLLWVAPSVVAGLLGYRVLRSGNPAGRVVMVVAAVVAVLITIGCAVIWWL